MNSFEEEADSLDEKDFEEKAMIRISNYANVFMLELKIFAAVGSGSLAIAASTLVQNTPSEMMSSSRLYSAVINASAVKLALWIYCRSSRNEIVQAYAKDHYFDVVTNVVGLIASVLGDKLYWWIDPAGGLILEELLLAGMLWRGYSVSSLKSEFVAKLHERMRSCVDIESSSLGDLSKVSGLTTGEKIL